MTTKDTPRTHTLPPHTPPLGKNARGGGVVSECEAPVYSVTLRTLAGYSNTPGRRLALALKFAKRVCGLQAVDYRRFCVASDKHTDKPAGLESAKVDGGGTCERAATDAISVGTQKARIGGRR